MDSIPVYPIASLETHKLNDRLTTLQRIHPGIRAIFQRNGSMTLFHTGSIPADAMHKVMATYPGTEITLTAFQPSDSSLAETVEALMAAIEAQHQ